MSRDAFFEKVKRAQLELGIGHQGAWFRGVKRRGHTLKPSLLREPALLRKERNLMARFVTQGARYVAGMDKWERLAYMQHYGVPTKLLDWSTNLTAAIYFALAYNVESNEDLDGPHIWLLHPFRLNGLAARRRIIFDNMDDIPQYEATGRDGTNWQFELPIAVALNWHDPRIEHQQGVFTYHGTRLDPLNDLAPDCVRKIEIDGNEIGDLLSHLRDSGVTHHGMFQSPDALGMDIKQRALRRGLLWGEGARVPRFLGDLDEEGGEAGGS